MVFDIEFFTEVPISYNTVGNNIMRRTMYNRNSDHDASGVYQALKDRRKAYYHGKYNREVFSVVLLLACVGMFLLSSGV